MCRHIHLALLFLLGLAFQSWGQQQIKGVVVNGDTGEPLEFVTVYESISGEAVISGGDGSFALEIANGDSIRLEISYLGFRSVEIVSELESADSFYRIELISEAEDLDAVVVQASAFKDIIGVPVSLKTTEGGVIRSNPGGGGDFAKVIQSLPGLTSLNSFRNDLIIRGGAPTENAFFVDDIEIPVINHLTTQGSTGGTISLLNSQHIREVDLIASGYPPNRPDAMSGVFNIYLTDGDTEKTNVNLGVDPTNAFLSVDGSMGDRLSYVGGVRRSYRQYILDLLGLATLPVYNDYLFKLKYRFKKNAELSFLLLGAVDRFKVNAEVNDSEIQQYLQDNLPSNMQHSSTTGLSYKWIGEDSYHILSVSYSDFYNEAERSGMVLGQESQILAYNSREKTYNARFEQYNDWDRLKLKYGVGYRHSRARYDVYNQFFLSDALTEVDYVSSISHNFYFGFGQLTYEVIPDRLELTLNQLMQISDINDRLKSSAFDVPKLNGSLVLSSNLSWNFSVGSYRQLPENILLGYLEDDELVNIDPADFIRSTQFTTGIELDSRSKKTQFLVEGYYKKYNQYPFNTRDNISLANFGADFGVIGNVPVQFEGVGTSYGLELFLKRASSSSLHGWLSYTWGRSEFEDRSGRKVPSSWDARHIFNAVIIRDFGQGWSLGLNFKYQSALPYTPFLDEVSSLVEVWDVNRIGIRDFSRINTARGKSLMLLDLRLGKSYEFEKSKLLVYLDLENVFADADSQQALILDRSRSPGQNSPVIINPLAAQSEQRYALKEIQNAEGVFIPSVGFEWSF